MKIPKEIIQKAIDAGWLFHGDKPLWDDMCDAWFVPDGDGGYVVTSWADIAMMPSFWQALGKAEGWEEPEVYWRKATTKTSEVFVYSTARWVNEAHTLYDLILTEQDTTDYWQSLLDK